MNPSFMWAMPQKSKLMLPKTKHLKLCYPAPSINMIFLLVICYEKQQLLVLCHSPYEGPPDDFA